MEKISAHLKPEEYRLYMYILWASYEDFSDRVLDITSREEYVGMLNAIRKFKILRMPLPDYLSNLKEHEFPVFWKAKQNMQNKIVPDLDDLSDADFAGLVMIIFRWEVEFA